MNEPDEKKLTQLLNSIERSQVDYPCYRRGLIWGILAAIVGFLPLFLVLNSLNNAKLSPWPWALMVGGVLGVIFWGIGTFRPPTE